MEVTAARVELPIWSETEKISWGLGNLEVEDHSTTASPHVVGTGADSISTGSE